MADGRGRWTEGPILPEVAAPPPARILVRGARLVRVYDGAGARDVAGRPRADGGRDAVILAWARLPGGAWVVLLAWTSYWAYESPPHQTALARFGWYVLDEQRVRPRMPPRALGEDQAWHGWSPEGELQRAIDGALLLLPERLRAAAATPASTGI